MTEKYELVEKLGEGAFGVVYKARHRVTRHPVAIKILTTDAAAHPEVALRFRREASIGNAIDHENIVRAIDFGEVDGQPYLVLELLDGVSLEREVRERGPLPAARAAGICAQVADALAAAHAHHVIHRDLKPENIFLVRRGGQGDFVKVLDFGIAKLTANAGDGVKTRSHMLLGSPVTMSPEQCRGAAVDARSDVYALGVVLFFAVAGEYPFRGSQGDVLSAHLRDAPPRLCDARPDVPRALSAVVTRAMAKDPAARFQSMAELRRALLPLVDAAAAATVMTRATRRRHARPAWQAAALVVLGFAVLAGLGAARFFRTRHATFLAVAPISVLHEKTTTTEESDAGAAPPHAEAIVKAKNVEVANGWLTVAVLPFAEVTVDGRAAGTTPLRNLPLRAGAHTIELRNEGLHRRTRRTERIEPGAHRRIQLDWSGQP